MPTQYLLEPKGSRTTCWVQREVVQPVFTGRQGCRVCHQGGGVAGGAGAQRINRFQRRTMGLIEHTEVRKKDSNEEKQRKRQKIQPASKQASAQASKHARTQARKQAASQQASLQGCKPATWPAGQPAASKPSKKEIESKKGNISKFFDDFVGRRNAKRQNKEST